MTLFTGTVSDILSGQTPNSTTLGYITDALQALSEAPTSWTPTWSASGTAPAIGNGTLTGNYLRVGKLVIFSFKFVAGSTTTFGTGTYTFTLPVAANLSSADLIAPATLLDNSTTTTNEANAVRGSAGSDQFVLRYHGGTGNVGQTVPWTWATSDRIEIAASVYWTA